MHNNAASEECLLFIDWAIVELIELAALDNLSKDAVNIIVERDTLKIKEFDLFKFVNKWYDNNSTPTTVSQAKKIKLTEKSSESETIDQKKRLPMFDKIRYPIMSLDEFNECYKLKRQHFLSADIVNIFEFISTGIRNDGLFYSTTKRAFDPTFKKEVNRVTFSSIDKVICGCGDPCEIEFSVNKPVLMLKVYLTMFVISGSIYSGCEPHTELHKFQNTIKFAPILILHPNVQYRLSVNICERNGFDSGAHCCKIVECVPSNPDENYFNFPNAKHAYIVRSIIFSTQDNKKLKQ